MELNEALDLLGHKITKLIEELRKLRKEKEELEEKERNFPYQELEDLRHQCHKYKAERDILREKLDILLKQLESLEESSFETE